MMARHPVRNFDFWLKLKRAIMKWENMRQNLKAFHNRLKSNQIETTSKRDAIMGETTYLFRSG